MARAIFSEKLLADIHNNIWTEVELDLSEQNLGPEGAIKLAAALKNNSHIKSLDVRLCSLGPEDAQALAANSTLTHLDMGFNEIEDVGAQALAKNTTLRSLRVNHNGIMHARALAANKTLTTLDISDNNLDDEDAQAFAENGTLTTLDISETEITDVGGRALATNQTLTELSAEDTNMSPEVAAELTRCIAANKRRLANVTAFTIATVFCQKNLESPLKNSIRDLIRKFSEFTGFGMPNHVG